MEVLTLENKLLLVNLNGSEMEFVALVSAILPRFPKSVSLTFLQSLLLRKKTVETSSHNNKSVS